MFIHTTPYGDYPYLHIHNAPSNTAVKCGHRLTVNFTVLFGSSFDLMVTSSGVATISRSCRSPRLRVAKNRNMTSRHDHMIGSKLVCANFNHT